MAIHTTADKRRLIDMRQITHIMIDEAGVHAHPMKVTFNHLDGAKLIWDWSTPTWKKVLTYAINSVRTEKLILEVVKNG